MNELQEFNSLLQVTKKHRSYQILKLLKIRCVESQFRYQNVPLKSRVAL